MKICVPLVRPEGLSSSIEADPAEAQFLLFFNSEDDSFDEIDLSAKDVVVPDFDAVICSRINRQVFGALRQRGIEVYLTDEIKVTGALDEYRSGSIFKVPDLAGGGCGGGCQGHGGHQHDHGAASGCGCHSAESHGHQAGGCGGGCGGHAETHGGGCCGSAKEAHCGASTGYSREATLRIAVTSQNRKTVTEHAGKCRKFWIYEIQAGAVLGRTLLELPLEQSLHEWSGDGVHPIEAVNVLITGSVGEGMRGRLARWSIETVVTSEVDPDAAVASFLDSLAA